MGKNNPRKLLNNVSQNFRVLSVEEIRNRVRYVYVSVYRYILYSEVKRDYFAFL